MITPNEPNITEADCVLPPCAGTGAAVDGGPGPGNPTPVELLIQPEPGFVNIGEEWEFSAILRYSDNTTKDVTDVATWDSSLLTVATVDAGVATGAAAGLATISATYGNLQAFGQITVVAVCTDSGVEITACLARDNAMLLRENGTARVALVRAGALQLSKSIRPDTDKMALVTFAGKRIINGPPVSSSEATIDCQLTSDQDLLAAAIGKYDVRPITHGGFTQTNILGIGGGLSAALAEATSARHVEGRKQVILLVVDGRDVVGNPVPGVVADDIGTAGISLVIIGITIPDDYSATLRAMATTYFGVDKASDCANLMARLTHAFCDGYSFVPTDPDNGGTKKSDQTISFDPIGNQNVTADNFEIHANASSALPVTFTVVSGPASISGGNIVHVTGLGLVTIRASQAGNDTYNAAPNVDRTFWVSADNVIYMIENYGDTTFPQCSACAAPAGGSKPWDGTFIAAPNGPYPDRVASSNIVQDVPGDAGDRTVFSINGKAFNYAVIEKTPGFWLLTITCWDGGSSKFVWQGTKVDGDTPVGTYTTSGIGSGSPHTVNIVAV